VAVRALGILWLMLGGFVLMACSADGNPAAQPPGDEPLPFAVARAAGVERGGGAADPATLGAQVASNNRFAVAMYGQLVRSAAPGENLFFSPYSMSTALAMAAGGARGTTAAQMRTALAVTLPDQALHEALDALALGLEEYVEATAGVELEVVNSIWGQTGYAFAPAYLELLARAYGAGVNLLDFAGAPEASRRVINDWVAAQTRRRIEDLLPPGSISAQTRLVLTNAVYFLGEWLYRFDAALTATADFQRLDGSAVAAPLMQLGRPGERVEVEYARDARAGVRAINLYYRGQRLCMTVVLPDAGTFAAFEAGLSVEALDPLLAGLRSTDLPPVRLPRFRYTSASVSLREPLQALGMRDAFEPGAADFSGIDGSRSLYIADVLQKAFVAVDEQGTEAAAATAVVFDPGAAPDDAPQFVADRPFVFLVRDTHTGLVLFMGRIVDPTRSE